ncbi:MAG: hypothetical protein KBC43_13480 [Bacteroidales bacterium]|nr:hypothetical protein [Bacteroidales bacterium]
MKAMKMMLLLAEMVLIPAIQAQEVQLVKQTFFGKHNLEYSGMRQGPDGKIYVSTSKESFPDDHDGVAIRQLEINGDLKGSQSMKLDIVQNFILTPDGGYLVLFNYDMFDDAQAVKLEYSNSYEYYDAERDYVNMPGIIKLSKYGSLEWIIELDPAMYFSDDDESSLFVTPDSKYWVIFNYSADDTTSEFGAQNDFTRIILLEPNGSKVFEKDFQDDDHGLLRAPVLLDDGRIMLFSDYRYAGSNLKLKWIDRKGELVQSFDIKGLVDFFTHDVIPAGNEGFILTGRENEQNYIALVDNTGQLKWKNPTEGVIHTLTMDKETVLILSTEKFMYTYKDGMPVQFIVTRLGKDGSVQKGMSFTSEEPVEFRKMMSTGLSLVLAGNVKQGEQNGVAVYVTVPEENADIFRNMFTYDYTEYLKAIRENNVGRIAALASFGISMEKKPGQPDNPSVIESPLMFCIDLGMYDMAEILLKHGADPNVQDKMPARYRILDKPELYELYLKPLMLIAIRPDFPDMDRFVSLLAAYKVNLSDFTSSGNVFGMAMMMENTAFMDCYKKYVTISGWDMDNYMAKSISSNLPKTLKWLLDNGGNPNNRDASGLVILDQGLDNGSKEVKAVLKEWQKTHKK